MFQIAGVIFEDVLYSLVLVPGVLYSGHWRLEVLGSWWGLGCVALTAGVFLTAVVFFLGAGRLLLFLGVSGNVLGWVFLLGK